MTDLPVRPGQRTSFSKTVAESDVYAFAGLTGDFAPQHVNDHYMRQTRFGRRIAHGALLVGFMSTTSTQIIGDIASDGRETPLNYGYDRIRFTAPVFLGDTVTVSYEIVEVDSAKRRAFAKIEATNQDGTVVAVATNILQWVGND